MITMVQPSAVAENNQVNGAAVTQCQPNTPFYAVNHQVSRYTHPNPLEGSAHGPATTIGLGGWDVFGRVIGGPDGRMYGIERNGTLSRYQWNGSKWTVERDRISGEWGEHATGNKLATVDQNGHFYTVNSDNQLHWSVFDEQTRTWRHRVIDSGLENIDLITAAGAGVVYMRTTDGKLIRSRYDAASQRWIQYRHIVGLGGWQIYSGITSPGGDILYAVQPGENNGKLRWYRYIEEKKDWHKSASGVTIGQGGWNDFRDVFPSSNSCVLTVNHTPARPSIGTDLTSAVNMFDDADGATHYAWVNGGELRHARQTDPNNAGTVTTDTMQGYKAFRGSATSVSEPDGRVRLLALGGDSEIRGARQSGKDDWSGFTVSAEGGYMITPPAMIQGQDKLTSVFAIDAKNELWRRTQTTENGDLMPWSRIEVNRPAGMPAVSSDQPTVLRVNDDIRIIVRDTAGTYWSTNVSREGVNSGWSRMPGEGFVGPAAVTADDHGTVLYARGKDGKVHRRVDNAEAQWQLVDDLTGEGPVTAAATADGRVRVAARGGDGRLWSTIEKTAGSGKFSGWKALSDKKVDNAPKALLKSNGLWVVAFLEQGNLIVISDKDADKPAG